MFSPVDKGILGSVGVTIAAGTIAASIYAWSMIHADGSLPSAVPAADVATLSSEEGSVKTRHRETLAWNDGEVKQVLREGDRIRTLGGSRATILYTEGLEITIEPNSQITLHGPTETNGEKTVAAIDVVDGAIRAKVSTGRELALRDATGHEQGRIKATDSNAEIALHAGEEADGALGMKVLSGSKVAMVDGAGAELKVFSTGEEHTIGSSIFAPIPTATPIAANTPLPPLESGPAFPIVHHDGGNVRIQLPLPAGVKQVLVRGKPATILPNGNFEVELFDLPLGNNVVNIVFIHDDGHAARQPLTIRIQ